MSTDYAVTINLPTHKRGDEWPGIPVIGPIIIDGTTPAEELTRIRCHFVCRSTPALVYRLDTDTEAEPDAPIIIDDAVNWEAHVPPIYTGFLSESGEWEWDMEFYRDGRTVPITLYKGVLTVKKDTTSTVTPP
jgi:hypothetical protein